MAPTKSVSTNLEKDNKSSSLFSHDLLLSSTSSSPSPFQELLNALRKEFSRPDKKVNIDEVWRILGSYKSNPNDWKKYVHYDMLKYKRNLVDEDENYNVMIIGWGPNTKSCIHDHSGSNCFMKVLDGDLIESRFAWPNENRIKRFGNDNEVMTPLSSSRIGFNKVAYINDKVGLHCVENVSMNETAASLHVYIPPLKNCKAFDQYTGQARDCKLTFYSKCGKIMKDQEEDDQAKPWLDETESSKLVVNRNKHFIS